MFDSIAKQTDRFLSTFIHDAEIVRARLLYADAFAAADDDDIRERLIDLISSEVQWHLVSDKDLADVAPYLLLRARPVGEPATTPRSAVFPLGVSRTQKLALFNRYAQRLGRGNLKQWEAPYFALLMEDPTLGGIALSELCLCIEESLAVRAKSRTNQSNSAVDPWRVIQGKLVGRWLEAETWTVERLWPNLSWLFRIDQQATLDYGPVARHLMPLIEDRRPDIEAALLVHNLFDGVGCTPMRPALSAFLAECQSLNSEPGQLLFAIDVFNLIQSTPGLRVGSGGRSPFLQCAAFPDHDRLRWFLKAVESGGAVFNVDGIERLGLSLPSTRIALAAAAFYCDAIANPDGATALLNATGIANADALLAQALDLGVSIDDFLLQIEHAEQTPVSLPGEIAPHLGGYG